MSSATVVIGTLRVKEIILFRREEKMSMEELLPLKESGKSRSKFTSHRKNIFNNLKN